MYCRCLHATPPFLISFKTDGGMAISLPKNFVERIAEVSSTYTLKKSKKFYKFVCFKIMRGWEEVGMFGESLKIYKKGDARRIIDKKGKIVIEYKLEN